MITAYQHIPNWSDGLVPKRNVVASVADLLALPWIASWGQDDLVASKGVVSVRPFHRWSVADPGTSRQTLMAEFANGDHFRVVAFLTSDEPIALPEWHETETARLRRERWNRGETN